MSKRPSLFHQLLTSLREQVRFGQSKHEAKRIAINKAHAQGRSGFGVAPEGVYSVVTFSGYRQVAHEFAVWCKKHDNPRTMEEARIFVAVYLEERIAHGKSAWTIQRDRSALRKIFRDSELAGEVKVPRRKLKNIKRSRYVTKMDLHFNPDRHRDLVDFCKATGLRRHEMAALKPENVYWKVDKLMAFVAQGKGGKAREVTVMPGMELRVLQIIEGKQVGRPIFECIPTKMDVHYYRAEYATARLEEAQQLEVSRDLGHNRVDVIRGHYARRR